MGFDLYGVKPNGKVRQEISDCNHDKTKLDKYFKWQDETKGAYFRNNCWWWRPLWDYVCKVCLDIITEKECNSGHYNDGCLITADKSKKISIRLTHLIRQGAVKKYEEEYMGRLNSLPLEDCWLCNGTGKRTDIIVKNGCNCCHGTGKIKSKECDYPFSEENVKSFAEFCEYSGGFEIN